MIPSGPLRLRAAVPEDAAVLSAIARAAKAHWGYPDSWLAAWRDALTIAPEWLKANAAVIAERDGSPLGFVGWLADPSGVWTLEHLWVLPAAMGSGIGRALLRRAEECARAGGAQALELDADPFAEPFYLHCGARPIGTVESLVLGSERRLPRLRLDLR